MTAIELTKRQLVQDFATRLKGALNAGQIVNRPVPVTDAYCIPGPVAAVVRLNCGLDTPAVMKKFKEEDSAIVRQFAAWSVMQPPIVYQYDRYISLEIGWDDAHLERNWPLRNINQRPFHSGQWAIGVSETGETITTSFCDEHPHGIVAGTTGSGKTTQIIAMLSQLTRHAAAGDQFILMDGKDDRDFVDLDRLPGIVGPLVTTPADCLAALQYACQIIDARRADKDQPRPGLYIIIDEIQAFAKSPAVMDMLLKIASQGRSFNVHLMLATQRPSKSTIATDLNALLQLRIVMLVADLNDSMNITKNEDLRADRLLGRGDGLVVTPRHVDRVQGVFVEPSDVQPLLTHQPLLDTWPPFEAEDLGTNWPTVAELAAALSAGPVGGQKLKAHAAQHGVTIGDNNRAAQLAGTVKGITAWLAEKNLSVCLPAPAPAMSADISHTAPLGGGTRSQTDRRAARARRSA